MKITKYLIIRGVENRYRSMDLKVDLREKEPKLSLNEIALKLELDVPEKLFKRPVLNALIKVPEAAIMGNTITPEITDNIEKIIKETTGLNMVIRLSEATIDAETGEARDIVPIK